MTDIVLNSLETSSMAVAMTEGNSSLEDFFYANNKSCVPFSKNKYELSLPECDFGSGKIRVKLQKHGLVQNITLKLRIKVEASDVPSVSGTNNNRIGESDVKSIIGGGIGMIRSCNLTNGKDILLSLNDEVINFKISEMVNAKELHFKKGANFGGFQALDDRDESDVVYTLHEVRGITQIGVSPNQQDSPAKYAYCECYVPLLFSPFENDKLSEFMDMSFYQQLYVELEFHNYDRVFSGTFSNSLKPSIEYNDCSLIVNYLNFRNRDHREIQQKMYNRELNYVWRDYWINDDVKVETTDTQLDYTSVIDLPCDKLTRKIYIRLTSGVFNGLRGLDYIKSIKLNAVGRVIQEWSGSELLLMRGYNCSDKNNPPIISRFNKNAHEYKASKMVELDDDGTELPFIGGNYRGDILIDEGGSEEKIIGKTFGFTEADCLESQYYCIDFTLPYCEGYGNNPVFNGGVSFKNNMNANLEITFNPPSFEDSGLSFEIKSFCEYYCVWNVNPNDGVIQIADNK